MSNIKFVQYPMSSFDMINHQQSILSHKTSNGILNKTYRRLSLVSSGNIATEKTFLVITEERTWEFLANSAGTKYRLKS